MGFGTGFALFKFTELTYPDSYKGKMMINSKIWIGSIVFLATMQTALAVPIVYTDRAAWEAAVTGAVTTETFDGVATQILGTGTTTLGQLGFTLDADDPDDLNRVYNVGSGNNAFQGRVSNGQTFAGGPVASFIDVAFGGSVNAFGADFASTTTGARLQFSNGSTILFEDWLTGAGTGFLGIIDTMDFSSVVFSAVRPASDNVAEVFQMDDVSWNRVAVPEPGILALLGIGLFGMGLARRRRV